MLKSLPINRFFLILISPVLFFQHGCSREIDSFATITVADFYKAPEKYIDKTITLIGYQDSAHLKDGKYIILRDPKGKRKIQVHKDDQLPLFDTTAYGQNYAITGFIEKTTISYESISDEKTNLTARICDSNWSAKECENHFKRTRGYQVLLRKREFLSRRGLSEYHRYALIAQSVKKLDEIPEPSTSVETSPL